MYRQQWQRLYSVSLPLLCGKRDKTLFGVLGPGSSR